MILYTDCFTLGPNNPSKIGGGYTITDHIGNIIEIKKIFKNGFTNNEGEVLGILRCIEICDVNSEIYTDSTVARSWVIQGKSKARKDLTELLLNGKQQLIDKKSSVIWISRNENLAGIENENDMNRKSPTHIYGGARRRNIIYSVDNLT